MLLLRVTLLFLLACLMAACSRGAALSAEKAAQRPSDRPVILWLDWPTAQGLFRDESLGQRFSHTARTAGVTHLALESREWNGRMALGEGGSQHALEVTVQSLASASGLRLAAVHALFLAPPDTPVQELSHRARWHHSQWLIEPIGPVARSSPASKEVRSRELTALRALARDPSYDIVLLTGLGFEDQTADVGPTGRAQFQRLHPSTTDPWPASVLGLSPPTLPFGPDGRGPLWNPWTTWRATLLRSFLDDARLALHAEAAAVPPRLAVLVDSPYPAHQRQGLNWATSDAPVAADNPWLSSGYSRTGAGSLLDALALGFWEPELLTQQQAEAAGFAWWASIEGGSLAARRYLPPATQRWGALVLADGTEWPKAVHAIRTLNHGIVLIGADPLLQDPQAWQALAHALR